MNFITVFTTVSSRAEAQLMAKSLLEQGLVACVQISEIESFYHWDGAVQHAPEFRLLFKTVDEKYSQVEQAIKVLHSYTLPAIHAVAISQISAPYAQWLAENC